MGINSDMAVPIDWGPFERNSLLSESLGLEMPRRCPHGPFWGTLYEPLSIIVVTQRTWIQRSSPILRTPEIRHGALYRLQPSREELSSGSMLPLQSVSKRDMANKDGQLHVYICLYDYVFIHSLIHVFYICVYIYTYIYRGIYISRYVYIYIYLWLQEPQLPQWEELQL